MESLQPCIPVLCGINGGLQRSCECRKETKGKEKGVTWVKRGVKQDLFPALELQGVTAMPSGPKALHRLATNSVPQSRTMHMHFRYR